MSEYLAATTATDKAQMTCIFENATADHTAFTCVRRNSSPNSEYQGTSDSLISSNHDHFFTMQTNLQSRAYPQLFDSADLNRFSPPPVTTDDATFRESIVFDPHQSQRESSCSSQFWVGETTNPHISPSDQGTVHWAANLASTGKTTTPNKALGSDRKQSHVDSLQSHHSLFEYYEPPKDLDYVLQNSSQSVDSLTISESTYNSCCRQHQNFSERLETVKQQQWQPSAKKIVEEHQSSQQQFHCGKLNDA